MSRMTEEIADKLAQDVLKAMEETGDDGLANEIAQVIGASSPSTEEMFRTAVRVRQAEGRARRHLEAKLSGKAVAAPVNASADAPGTDIGGDH